MEIANMTSAHWPEVRRIYLEGIETGKATFQTEALSWEDWDKGHITQCRFVAVEGGKVLGWAALSKVSQRSVYAGVAEVSIYIGKDFRGKGVGKTLFGKLIDESEKQGFWTLQSGIFSDNIESINLHQKMGFRMIGFREKVGKLHGAWKDNVIMERRSKVVGVD